MNKRLAIAAVVAVAASFFASQFPDGLDKTAQTLGFAAMARETAAPMTGYKIAFISQPRLSTAAAALAGLSVVYVLFRLAAKLLNQQRKIARQ